MSASGCLGLRHVKVLGRASEPARGVFPFNLQSAASSRKTASLSASISGRPSLGSCSRHLSPRAAASAAAPVATSASDSAASCSAIDWSALQPTALLFAAFVKFVMAVTAKAQKAVLDTFPQIVDIKAEDINHQIRQLSTNARLAAFIAPFAAASSDSLTAVYTRTFERAAFGFAKMYLFLLFMRVLLSWFPSIDWNSNPWTFLRLITEPYLQIYRGILPPLFGQLDFTPLFGFLILQDVVEVMAPTYTMGMHAGDTSTRWTTSDVMCYFDGF